MGSDLLIEEPEEHAPKTPEEDARRLLAPERGGPSLFKPEADGSRAPQQDGQCF